MQTKSLFWALRIAGMTVLLSAAATALFAQDFTIHMQGDNGVQGATYYVSANAIRRTTPDISDVIDRLDRGTIIYLNHRNKSYTEIPAAEAHTKIAEGMNNIDPRKKAMLQQMGFDKPAQLTKIGPGEDIAGYATEKYSLKTAMAEGELWITQSLQFPAAYYKDFNLLSGVSGPIGDSGKVAEVRGVVLKRIMTGSMGRSMSGGHGETAVSVERGTIAASTFEPPADYQKAAATKTDSSLK